MADDTTTTTTINVNTNVGSVVSDMTDSIDQGLKEFKKFTKAIVESGEEAESTFQKTIKTVNRLTKSLKPGIKEFNNLTDVADNAQKAVTSFGKAYAMALYSGKQSTLIATAGMTKHAISIRDAARQTKVMSDEVNRLSKEFKDATDAVMKANEQIKTGEAEQARLQKSIKDRMLMMQEARKNGVEIAKEDIDALINERGALQKLGVELVDHKNLLREASENAERLAVESIKATDALKEEQEKLIQANKALFDNAAAARQHNRDLRKMAGGVTAVSASFEELLDNKVMDWFKQVGAVGLVLGGFALINKALSQTEDHAQAVSRIALTLGDTSEVGIGRYAKSTKEASQTVSHLTKLSVELGYSMDELNEVANKVRAGIRMDREGRLSEQAIRDLTKEAAQFSRISGLELGASVDLLETRIKRFGMTAAEANASVRDMRVTLTQMTAGNKANTIAMGDMVNIIEEASAASQSYIVDTRIMTQALRAAVNQAEHLGAAQKQAKDVAQSVGKILSGAPDFIKIPAGFSLVDQLLGKDADKILNRLDAGTRAQVKSIQESLRAGKLDYFVGAKALMDLIGQTDIGLEAQSKQLEATILQGPAAAELIAEQYGIENRATAFMITKMMQDTMEMRQRLGKDKISFATALVKETALFDEALDKTKKADQAAVIKRMRETGETKAEAEKAIKDLARKDMPETLRLKGLNPEQARQYMEIYEQALSDEARLTKEINDLKASGGIGAAEEIAKKEEELYTKTTMAKTKALQEMLHPLDALTKKIAGPEGTWDVTALLDPEALAKANIQSGRDLAKMMGVEYSKLNNKDRKFLNDAVTESGAKTVGELEEWRRQQSAANLESVGAIDRLTNGMTSPLNMAIGWVKAIAAKMDAFGPGGLMITGLVGIAAGLLYIRRGQEKNAYLIANLMEAPIFQGVSDALRVTGRGGPGGAGGGGEYLPEGKDDEIKKQREKRQSEDARKRKAGTKLGRAKTWAKSTRVGGALAKGASWAGDLAKGALGGAKGILPALGKKAHWGITGALGAKDMYDLYQSGERGMGLVKGGLGVGGGIAGGLGVGALGMMLGGPAGAVAGSMLGSWAGEALGDAIGNLLPDDLGGPDTVAMAGVPTMLPTAEASKRGINKSLGGFMGGGGAGESLATDVGLHSLTPDGALTLKVRGMMDFLAQSVAMSRKLST